MWSFPGLGTGITIASFHESGNWLGTHISLRVSSNTDKAVYGIDNVYHLVQLQYHVLCLLSDSRRSDI